nr:MAG TPA: hypothetical protein [Caudoviricetes sp.]
MINMAYVRLKQSNITDDAKHIALANTHLSKRLEYVSDHIGE